MKKIMIAGGGTGGHVLPLATIIRTLHHFPEKIHYMWVGHSDGLEYRYYQKLSNEGIPLEFHHLRTGKFRREKNRKAMLLNIRDILVVLPWGILRSVIKMAMRKPHVVFSKGGHVALPVVVAARIFRIPVVLHESDTSPGLVSRLTHRFAVRSYTGFEGVLPGAKVVGQVLSNDIAIDYPHEHVPIQDHILVETVRSARENGKTILLISGGSQGSFVLNRAIQEALIRYADLFQDTLMCVVVGGLRETSWIQKQNIPANLYPTGLIAQETMGLLMAYAHAAVVRGGTTTLQEAKLYDLPLCIVPLPITHDQYGNAAYYCTRYQDIVIDERQDHMVDKLAYYMHAVNSLYQEKKMSANHIDTLSMQYTTTINAVVLRYTISCKQPSVLSGKRREKVMHAKKLIAQEILDIANHSVRIET